MAGRGILREILGRLLRVERPVEFFLRHNGKPRLAAPAGERFMHFNVALRFAGRYAVSQRA